MRELYAHRQSLVHQMDARVKVIFTLALILFIGLSPFRAWPAYILFFCTTLSISILARLGTVFVLKRSLMAVPFMLAAVPLVFTGPAPHVSISVFDLISVQISPEGCLRCTSIAIKSWISVQAAILMAATTRFPDLLLAFRQLKVPRLFISIIGLMWRYLFVIVDEAIRMMRARTSRSAALPGIHRKGGSVFWHAKITGGMAGSLFLRSLERSDRVYAAMLSRGYTGEPPIEKVSILPLQDRRFLVTGILLIVFIWLLAILSGG